MTAAAYLLRRIADDPRVAYHFDPMTQSMELLTAEYAKEKGIDVEVFRNNFYASLRFERPRCSNCSCKDCDN
jgi:hypothetical protein